MQLKKYQQKSLNLLQDYLECVPLYGAGDAYKRICERNPRPGFRSRRAIFQPLERFWTMCPISVCACRRGAAKPCFVPIASVWHSRHYGRGHFPNLMVGTNADTGNAAQTRTMPTIAPWLMPLVTIFVFLISVILPISGHRTLQITPALSSPPLLPLELTKLKDDAPMTIMRIWKVIFQEFRRVGTI